MYHSITFGDKNTWEDWHLVPTSRPYFSPPRQKTNIIDIPGGNGSIDLSTALTGYPVFENRQGSIEFVVVNGYNTEVGDELPWQILLTHILEYLHGKTMMATLEDDPGYFYFGRFEVSDWKSEENNSKVTIDYDVRPYKQKVNSFNSPWKWDPFNFELDAITSGNGDIELTTEWQSVNLQARAVGTEPIIPMIKVESETAIEVRFKDSTMSDYITKTLEAGDILDDDFILVGHDAVLEFRSESGKGKVTVDFTEGRL